MQCHFILLALVALDGELTIMPRTIPTRYGRSRNSWIQFKLIGPVNHDL